MADENSNPPPIEQPAPPPPHQEDELSAKTPTQPSMRVLPTEPPAAPESAPESSVRATELSIGEDASRTVPIKIIETSTESVEKLDDEIRTEENISALPLEKRKENNVSAQPAEVSHSTAQRGAFVGSIEKRANALRARQSKRDAKLERIMQFARNRGSVRNDEIKKILRVSDATASRYANLLVLRSELIRTGRGRAARYAPR